MGNLIRIFLFFVIVVGLIIYFVGRFPNIANILNFKLSPGLSPFNQSSTIGISLPGWNPTFPKGISFTMPSFGSNGTLFEGVSGYLIPQGFKREDISPYFKKVRISSAASYSFSSAQLQLSSYLSQGERVDITGWRIKSNHGDIIIPQAVSNYNPSGFGADDDIVLSGNISVNIYSGASPISRNLRLNKCTGYLNNVYKFNPPLPTDCPTLFTPGDIIHLSGMCQSYLLSLGACKLPDPNFSNLLPGTVEGNNCRAFLNTITPKACYDRYGGYSDFLSNAWIVWVNQSILDPQHDQINLFDRNGLLVDQHNY